MERKRESRWEERGGKDRQKEERGSKDREKGEGGEGEREQANRREGPLLGGAVLTSCDLGDGWPQLLPYNDVAPLGRVLRLRVAVPNPFLPFPSRFSAARLRLSLTYHHNQTVDRSKWRHTDKHTHTRTSWEKEVVWGERDGMEGVCVGFYLKAMPCKEGEESEGEERKREEGEGRMEGTHEGDGTERGVWMGGERAVVTFVGRPPATGLFCVEAVELWAGADVAGDSDVGVGGVCVEMPFARGNAGERPRVAVVAADVQLTSTIFPNHSPLIYGVTQPIQICLGWNDPCDATTLTDIRVRVQSDDVAVSDHGEVLLWAPQELEKRETEGEGEREGEGEGVGMREDEGVGRTDGLEGNAISAGRERERGNVVSRAVRKSSVDTFALPLSLTEGRQMTLCCHVTCPHPGQGDDGEITEYPLDILVSFQRETG